MFIGKLPREIFEDELIPLCEESGKIWDLRLMIDPASGFNKGYCFVTYCNPGDSAKAAERVNITLLTIIIDRSIDELILVKWLCHSARKDNQSEWKCG